jgi:hypothetical protein
MPLQAETPIFTLFIKETFLNVIVDSTGLAVLKPSPAEKG